VKRTWEDQFTNPVAYQDREGIGYCRLHELWDHMSYYPDDYEPHTYGEAKLPTKPYRKTGGWSDAEKELLKQYLDAGMDKHAIADRLCRTEKSVQRAIGKLIENNARKNQKIKKAV